MDDWLKKLLSGLASPQGSNPFKVPTVAPNGGTPPFIEPPTSNPRVGPANPDAWMTAGSQVVGTPLHSSVPDPNLPPFLQTRGRLGSIPTEEPSNVVSSTPPSTVTGNTAVNPIQKALQAMGAAEMSGADGANERVPSYGAPSAGNTAVNPFESALATARGDYQTAINTPAHKQNPFLQALFLGLQATQRVADPHNPANAQPVQYLGEAKRSDRIRKAGERLAPLEAQQERVLGENYRKAQIDNFYEDNANQKAVREDRAKKAAEDLMERKRTNFYKRNPNFSAKNATPAQIKQLAEFGETPESVGEYDFSKPNFKQIGGVTYKWDNNEKAFVDTNAAKDPSKEFMTVKLKDPETKEVHTLVTTKENYAKMLNARTVAGMQIEAAEKRQEKSQQFTADENEKTRQHQRERDALNARMKTAADAYDKAVAEKRDKDAALLKLQLLQLTKEYKAVPPDDE